MRDAQSEIPTPLSPADARALDLLVESGFDAGRAAEGADGELAARIARVSGLLASLEPQPIAPVDARALTDVTMARVLRARVDQTTAEALALSPDDGAALDALMAAGWDPEETPARHAPRARRIAAALTGLSDPLAARTPEQRADLVEATLARVQREIDGNRLRLDPVALEGASIGAGGFRLRLADIVSIAAMLILTFGVVFPAAGRLREEARIQACAGNLQNTGVGFALYANQNDGRLPMNAAGFDAGAATGGKAVRWWNVGEGKSHSANLFTLAREGYITLRDLTCPGNALGNPNLDPHAHSDWRNPEEVSYSYQLPPAAGARLVWSGRVKLVVLSDRSPVIDRARRGEPVDPMAGSVMHKGRGQNLLISDGSAGFVMSPVLGNGDNIWLPRDQERAARPTLHGVERPAGIDDAFVGP